MSRKTIGNNVQITLNSDADGVKIIANPDDRDSVDSLHLDIEEEVMQRLAEAFFETHSDVTQHEAELL